MFLGQVVRYSGKTTFTERYLSFPTPMDKIVTSAIFGKSSLPPVNNVNRGYANTNMYFDEDCNTYLQVRDKKGRIKALKPLTSFDDMIEALKERNSAVEVSADEVKYAISSRYFFYKNEGDCISDASFANIDWNDDLQWYKATDILGQKFLVAFKKRDRSADIVHAFFPITVGDRKWAVESVVGIATEGVTIAATQYVNCKYNGASYDEDGLIMDKINDLAREKVVDPPYILCFGKDYETQTLPKTLAKFDWCTEDFWARRKSIYRRWKKSRSAQNDIFVSETVCVGRTLEGERQISFSKSPLLLQLDCIGSVWLDSLIGYVFSCGKSYLSKALNSDVVQAAIQTTYSYLAAWYPPFKQGEDDPVRALGSWDNICSGFLDLEMDTRSQKLTGEMWSTHRLIENRALKFPLLTFERGTNSNNHFATFFVSYDPEKEDYVSYYYVGTYEGFPYQGRRNNELKVLTFADLLSGDVTQTEIRDSTSATLRVMTKHPNFVNIPNHPSEQNPEDKSKEESRKLSFEM